ncbi:MotA/TolQ/ExbB proton channel family protein [Roseomonas sp. NAR14]|uniref:MotA/TolQ/ExbB proton channel family protein n=1 Tax=Roseomonas acroporae TaxID=2937791 RepID=A0A9X1Y7N6_9PROT|nr:MotA/TolQ/ExbB proton channel family protein [Roseomonas acroporae]MCK8783587.1 MotA/TolQ/ExbB proton channel family protein [Roseomonas acroporae]
MNPTPAPAAPDLSLVSLFLHADMVVKGVMVLLVLASVACWAIIIEKTVAAIRLRRQARILASVAASGDVSERKEPGLAADVLRAGLRDWREGRDPGEGRNEFRTRIERAMRSVLAAEYRRVEPGLPLLATTGAVAPFVGLFGTVWGIMNSFFGIAASGDTSLAVVAPGIAEALFATAIGLVAAIPSVIAYNRLSISLGRIRTESIAMIGEISGRMARRAPRDAARSEDRRDVATAAAAE